jgi:hypothetical protein
MPTKLISLGQILDSTWDFYTKNFKTIMKVTVWFFLISLFTIMGSILSPAGNAQFLIEQDLLTLGHKLGMIISILAPSIGTGIVSIWIFLSLVRTIDELQTKKRSDLKAVSKKSWKDFFPYLIMSFLRGVIFIIPTLAVLPGLVLIVASIGLSGGIGFSGFAIALTILGAVTGIILLALFWVWFSFPGYEMVLEGKGIMQSLKESKRLVKGRFWPVFWRLLIPKVIFTVFVIFIQVAVDFVFTLFIVNPAISPEAFMRMTDIIGNLVLTTITVLTLPLYIIADYFIFDSLKKN